MQSLKDYITEARSAKKAIGHFNFSTIEVLWAIFDAARALEVPIIIGTSEGERKFIGMRQAVALIRSMREEYKYKGEPYPIFLNADHTYTLDGIKEAVDIGYDMVIFDGAELSFEENVSKTREAVEYAKSKNPGIVVEGELGYIGKSSKLLDAVPEEVLAEGKTTPEEAREFVEKTGVNAFAPSVGNLHGIVKGVGNPDLDIELIGQIKEKVDAPLVLHGGSGLRDEEFREAAKSGMSVIHINTEIRKAWRDGTESSLADDPDKVAPYKILKGAKEEVRKVVENRLKLFNNL